MRAKFKQLCFNVTEKLILRSPLWNDYWNVPGDAVLKEFELFAS